MRGLTASGPAAGTVAASWMSSIAIGNGVGVVAGSTYVCAGTMGGATMGGATATYLAT